MLGRVLLQTVIGIHSFISVSSLIQTPEIVLSALYIQYKIESTNFLIKLANHSCLYISLFPLQP